MNNLPEGLTLVLDESDLRIEDAQEIVHVRFGYGLGDPTAWSEGIVTRTCHTLGLTSGLDNSDADFEYHPLAEIISRWHRRLGQYEGFLA